MSIPIYLRFLDIGDFFNDLNSKKKLLLFEHQSELYLNEDNLYDVFDNLDNIGKFLYKISMSILNKDMYVYIEDGLKKDVQDDIIKEMNIIHLIDDKIKIMNKKFLGLIMYETKSIKYKGTDLYRIKDTTNINDLLSQLDDIINSYTELINNISSNFYFSERPILDNKNINLYNLVKNYYDSNNLDFSGYKKSVILDFEKYIFYENCYQSLIYNGLFLNDKKNIDKIFDVFLTYFTENAPDFDKNYFVDYTMNTVNNMENDYVKDKNLEYFFNSNILKNYCSLKTKELKSIFNIIFDNYVLKYNFSDYYKNISEKLTNNILKYACKKYDQSELEQLIKNYTNDDDKILANYIINSILNNENIFFKKYKNIINQLYNFIKNILENSGEYIFEYIEILTNIYSYKKELIESGNISNEINDNLNKVIKSCIISITDNYEDFSKILSLLYKYSLIFSFYDPVEFMVKLFEKFLTIVSYDNDYLENTKEYILFNDIKLENIFVEKDKGITKDIKYYISYFDDIRRLQKFQKKDNDFLTKVDDNKIIGYLGFNDTPYYEFPVSSISIINFAKIKLNINNFQKNIILLGEYHTKTPFNYQYIQNELNLCKEQNKYVELLLEITIQLFYNPEFKQKLNMYDNVYNLTKYSPCISDKSLKNVYSNVFLQSKDNVFCFDNVWYQNIDYRTANLIYSYIFNSNFNKRGKERILGEKGKTSYFEDNNEFYMNHFYYVNTMQYLNYTYKNFIFQNSYILFGKKYEYSKNDQLYKILESSIYLPDFKQNFKIKLKEIIERYNEQIKYANEDEDFNTYEYYLYNLNLYISDKSVLYQDLINNFVRFEDIEQSEVEELFSYIDNITVYDIYKVFILQITDYYNYIYNTYVNVDEKVKSFILSDPENIYGYRIFKFIKNFTDNFDSNSIKNVLSSFIIRMFTSSVYRYDYTDFISMFTNYHFMFTKFAYFDTFSSTLIRDSFIDINILNRIFFKYDEDDKTINNFPKDCKNILVYAGATHTFIILIYLTNSYIYSKYRNSLEYDLSLNNIGIYRDSLISINDFVSIYYPNYKKEKIILPSISSNFE